MTQTSLLLSMKYLGIDFGFKRVGLAISEGELASPYKTFEVAGLADLVEKIKQELQRSGIDKVIVGLPEGETGKAAQKFIDTLKKEGLDVDVADETLSTQNTTKLLIEMGIHRKKRSQTDAQAAAEILQNYLDGLK